MQVATQHPSVAVFLLQIVALFMPVFFGVAGLSTDLQALGRSDLLVLRLGLIANASVGKFLRAVIGGRAAGLTHAQALAVGALRIRQRATIPLAHEVGGHAAQRESL